jgi:hypothetical protein
MARPNEDGRVAMVETRNKCGINCRHRRCTACSLPSERRLIDPLCLTKIRPVLDAQQDDRCRHERRTDCNGYDKGENIKLSRIMGGAVTQKSNGQEQDNRCEHTGRKSAARNDHRKNMKQNAIDQHQGGKRQRQRRRNISKVGGDDRLLLPAKSNAPSPSVTPADQLRL